MDWVASVNGPLVELSLFLFKEWECYFTKSRTMVGLKGLPLLVV